MRPGTQGIRVLLALCALSVFVPWVPVLVWFLALGLLGGLGAALVEFVKLGKVRLEVERQPIVALSLDDEDEVVMHLRTNSTRPVFLSVRQLWPSLVRERSTTLSGVCKPGEALMLRFKAHGIARGTEPLSTPYATLSLWGLVERVRTVGQEAELSVLPNLKAVRRLHGQLNQYVLRGLGNRVAPRLGKGREFDRLRGYVTGDDYRDVAWKASARHRKLIVKEYRLDQSQEIVLCVDHGHRMAASVGYVTKVDHAVNGALLMSYMSNRMGDRVGMVSFGAHLQYGIGQGQGPAHLRRLTAFATGIKSEYIHTDYLALAAHLRRRIRHRALILIMTDLPEGDNRFHILRAVKMLTPQHLPLVMLLSDPNLKPASTFLPNNKDELCRVLVARDVWTARQQTIAELRHRGAMVVETVPHNAGVDSVNAYINIKRRQLL